MGVLEKSSDIQMMTRFVTHTLRLRLSVVQLFWICKRIPLQNTTVKQSATISDFVKTENSIKSTISDFVTTEIFLK